MDRNKLKRGYKYQIAIKEFLELVRVNNTNKLNNSGNNNNNKNKDFLPYL